MQALEQIDIELLRKKSENWIIICPKIEKIYVFEGPVEPDAAEEMPNIFLCFQTSKKYARVTKTRQLTKAGVKTEKTIDYEAPDDEILNFLSEPFLDFNLKQISQNSEILWVKKVFWDYTEIEGYQPTQIFPRESAPVKENTPAAETVVTKESAEKPLTEEQAEEIIKAMTVIRVSDAEIIIRHGNEEITAPCGDMGFKSHEKPWKMLMEILQDRNNQYFIGSYDKVNPDNKKDYLSKSKRFGNFSKRFIALINGKFSLSLPGDFNVFQNMKHQERAGIYRPKFRVDEYKKTNQQIDIKNLSKEAILERLTELLKQYKKENDISRKDQLFIEINQCVEHIKKNGWDMSAEQNKSYLDILDGDTVSDSDALKISDYIDEVTKKDKYQL